MTNEFIATIEEYGSFHEDEIIQLDWQTHHICLTIVEKTCADREQDRQVIRQSQLSGQQIQSVNFTSVGIELPSDYLNSCSEVDLSIIYLSASFSDGIPTVTIYCDGFVDADHHNSAKLVIVAEQISLKTKSK